MCGGLQEAGPEGVRGKAVLKTSAWGPITDSHVGQATAGKLGRGSAEEPLAPGVQGGAGRGAIPRRTHRPRLGLDPRKGHSYGERGWREDKRDQAPDPLQLQQLHFDLFDTLRFQVGFYITGVLLFKNTVNNSTVHEK